MPRKTRAEKDLDTLDEMSGNIDSWYNYSDTNIQNARIDKKFLFVSQWDDDERKQFIALQKPILTVNKIYDFYKKVVGEQRQNTPDLEVRSLNGNASQEAITLRADIVRNVTHDSKADIVYQTAFENALSGGFGAARIVVDYVSPKSFDQHIFLRPIENPFRAFFDPNSKEPTKHDGDYCGYYDVMSHSQFEEKYPDVPFPQSFPMVAEIKEFKWGDRKTISVVEYYKKEWFKFKLHKLSDGRTVTDKEYKKIQKEFEELLELEDVTQISAPLIMPEIVSTRESSDYKIMCYKAIYGRIIEKYKWPSKHFPIVYCVGDSHYIDGEERTLSFIRFVKDAQRYLNYCTSESAQAIKNSRREQFMGTPENVSGEPMEQMWRNPSVQQGILLANPDPITKQMPIKLPASEIPQTLLVQSQKAEHDIQSILGFYEANRGASGQELSGIALRERQRTGNLGIAVYFDNLNRMIEQIGRVILSLLPTVYDTERTLSLRAPDGSTREKVINQEFAGGKVENDVRTGEYDIVVKPGPSFAIQQEQALNFLIEMVRIHPESYPLVADLLAENVDIEKGPLLVERFKTMVPPDILAKEKGMPPPPPQPNPQMMLMQQEMQLKQAEMQLKQQQIAMEAEKDLREQQIEAAKIEIELQRLEIEKEVAQLKAGAEIGKAQLDYESEIATSMSKILSAQSNVAKHNHSMVKEILDSNR